MLNRETFSKVLADEVLKLNPEGTEIRFHGIPKNNGVVKDAMLICIPGIDAMPTFYIDDLYSGYRSGETILHLAEMLMESLEGHPQMLAKGTSVFEHLEEIISGIRYRLINRDLNCEKLKNLPHRDILDLSVVYCIEFSYSKTEGAAVYITNDMMNDWGIGEESLYVIAEHNMRKYKNDTCESLFDLMHSITAENGVSADELSAEKRNGSHLYVLSAGGWQYGASVLLFSEWPKKLAEQYGSDLAVIPSSVHEVLLSGHPELYDRDDLEKLITEINQSKLQDEEVLSGRAYRYVRETGELVFF